MGRLCPVCGEQIQEGDQALELAFEGESLSFCNMECLRLFKQFPDYFTGEKTVDVEIEDFEPPAPALRAPEREERGGKEERPAETSSPAENGTEE
ncbi:MAG: hypothetical protein P8Z49_07130 [Acidobacteriota bacterium]|jgi:YHS domain-containing protein